MTADELLRRLNPAIVLRTDRMLRSGDGSVQLHPGSVVRVRLALDGSAGEVEVDYGARLPLRCTVGELTSG